MESSYFKIIHYENKLHIYVAWQILQVEKSIPLIVTYTYMHYYAFINKIKKFQELYFIS
jgi:hypothetical protein